MEDKDIEETLKLVDDKFLYYMKEKIIKECRRRLDEESKS